MNLNLSRSIEVAFGLGETSVSQLFPLPLGTFCIQLQPRNRAQVINIEIETLFTTAS